LHAPEVLQSVEGLFQHPAPGVPVTDLPDQYKPYRRLTMPRQNDFLAGLRSANQFGQLPFWRRSREPA
jgi:hypothetical protein